MSEQQILETQITRNLEEIQKRIRVSAERSGRNIEDILLVAVSKKQPIHVVQAARAAGIRDFGENYPEQAVDKLDAFAGDSNIRWHMIGHLQSRKARLVAERFHFFQSLDSVEIAAKINNLLSGCGRKMPVLLQFNVGGEESKHGWDASDENEWGRFLPDVDQILSLPWLEVRGFMTMPPLESEPDLARRHFAKMYRLREFFRKSFEQQPFPDLSMGTSGDFEAAIMEGATIIRVGQAILGPRV